VIGYDNWGEEGAKQKEDTNNPAEELEIED